MFNSGGRLTNQNKVWGGNSFRGNQYNNYTMLPTNATDRTSPLWTSGNAPWSNGGNPRDSQYIPDEPEKLKLRFIEPNPTVSGSNSSQLGYRWRWPTTSFQTTINSPYNSSPWPALPATSSGVPVPYAHRHLMELEQEQIQIKSLKMLYFQILMNLVVCLVNGQVIVREDILLLKQ